VIKCNLCGKQFEGGRSMHSHMNRLHHDEYAAAGFDLEKISTGYTRKKPKEFNKIENDDPKPDKNSSQQEISERPRKLRPLNMSNPDEVEVYRLGYRYYDPESGLAFSIEEMKEEGWL